MESNVKYKEDEGRHGFMGDNDADTYTTWHWHSSCVKFILLMEHTCS